jgi:hypothetical protein
MTIRANSSTNDTDQGYFRDSRLNDIGQNPRRWRAAGRCYLRKTHSEAIMNAEPDIRSASELRWLRPRRLTVTRRSLFFARLD